MGYISNSSVLYSVIYTATPILGNPIVSTVIEVSTVTEFLLLPNSYCYRSLTVTKVLIISV